MIGTVCLLALVGSGGRERKVRGGRGKCRSPGTPGCCRLREGIVWSEVCIVNSWSDRELGVEGKDIPLASTGQFGANF